MAKKRECADARPAVKQCEEKRPDREAKEKKR